MVINEEMDFLVSRVAKVRKWLAAIAVLKTAAICMLFACVYIGGYILLDHLFNFSLPGRLIAFFLLIGSSAFLIYKLSRQLLTQVSYTNAANFIENNFSLNQQLVAAMEYYENKADYPYSKVLAEQLVFRVNKESESFRFDSVVEKWRGYTLAAFVSIGLAVVILYVHHNLSFLKTYFTRLAVPFTSVAPVSATALEAITGDIVAETESMLVFSAKIKGRIPKSGLLIISPVEQDSNDQKIQLKPIEESETEPKFETSEFFPETGQFQYRFEAGPAQTEWQNIDIREAPKIKSITAEIKLPENIQDDNALKDYTEPMKNNILEVIKDSSVTLHIESSSNLSEIEFTGPGGISSKKNLSGEKSFSHTFTANEEGSFEFELTDEKGLKSKNIPKLKIILKTDNPPQFELISPDGDYLATNVSSVPIEFEITDDFGLSSAEFIAELPEGEPISIVIPIQPDSNETKFSLILELEQYDLEIGDSIMFYANATDIKTTISNEENAASSEIYFIEIRPYLQIWHLNEGGGESNMPSMVSENLTTLLEYTRAVIKKTSVIAGKSDLNSDDRSQMNSINEDVEYCSSLLVQIRDDPDNEFNDAQKAVLTEILGYYEKASYCLERFDADNALFNEKEAYRILRKFVLELEMQYNPPESGESIPKETPDKVELKEAIEPPEIEQGQVEQELEKVQDEIEQLQSEQDQLKDELKKALEQQKQANKQAQAQAQNEQKLSDNSSGKNGNSSGQNENSSGQDGSNSPNDKSSQQGEGGSGQGSDSQQGESSQPGEGGTGQGSQEQQGNNSQQSEGNSGQGNGGRKGDSSQPGKGNSGQDGQGSQQSEGNSGKGGKSQQSESSQPGESGSGQGSQEQQDNSPQQGNNGSGKDSANPIDDSQNASDISGDSSEKSPAQAIAEAQLNMLKAKQGQLQNNVSQLQQKLDSISKGSEGDVSQASKEVQKHLGEALEYMEQFQDKMDELQYQPQEFDEKSKEVVEKMESAAKKLDSADKSLEKVLGNSEQEKLAKKLKENAELLSEDPDKLDEELSESDRERMEALRKAALKLLESNAGAVTVNVSQGGSNESSGTHVLTDRGGGTDKDTAREIASQFWFFAIELEKRKEQPIEDEPSDSKFVEAESSFFENAAKYNSGAN